MVCKSNDHNIWNHLKQNGLMTSGSPICDVKYDIRALLPPRRALAQRCRLDEPVADDPKDLRQVMGFVEFNEGHRYGDCVAGVDKVAAYGIGGLIAGWLAARAGLFNMLLVFAAKFWKLRIIAAVAIAVLARKLISGTKN